MTQLADRVAPLPAERRASARPARTVPADGATVVTVDLADDADHPIDVRAEAAVQPW